MALLWAFFILIYSFITTGYITYRYISVLVYKGYKEPYDTFSTLLIPVYNENFDSLRATIESAIKTKGNREIIVIDDGSTNDCWTIIKKYKEKIKAYRYEENKGKRYAQIYGINKSKGNIIITTDSATIMDENFVTEIIKPFSNPKIAATTGNVLVSNKNANLLTKIIDARYWSAFNFERKAQSVFGIVNCCSGPAAAYRKEYLLPLLEQYLNQIFLGNKCTYGDDRHLTTLLLKNYDIAYVDTAIVYTEAPTSLKKFIKQQIRWKKSWIRESYLLLKYAFKRSKVLGFNTTIEMILPFISLIPRLGVIILAILINPIFLLFYFGAVLYMAFLRNFYQLAHRGWKAAFYGTLYGPFHELTTYWLLFIALFTLKDTSWGTR